MNERQSELCECRLPTWVCAMCVARFGQCTFCAIEEVALQDLLKTAPDGTAVCDHCSDRISAASDFGLVATLNVDKPPSD